MFSRLVSRLRGTAAWRLSARTTIAIGIGTGAAFLIAYAVVARGVRERGDAWLLGECELLAEVSSVTPAGDLHATMVETVAELASHEVPAAPDDDHGDPAVFFLVTGLQGNSRIWVGPGERAPFDEAVGRAGWTPGEVFSIDVPGWAHPFRVVGRPDQDGHHVYLGFIDEYSEAMLHGIRRTFSWLWAGMLVFGFAVSCLSARGILRRVEEVTETAVRVSREGLQRRVQSGAGKDEIARLIAAFNRMLDDVENSVNQIRAVSDAVAHDVRSPATAIRGDLEMALMHPEADRLRDAAARALEGLDRLLGIVDTTLDVAEAEAGALRIVRRDHDLRELASEMVEIYRPAAEDKGLTLDLAAAGPIPVGIDHDLVRRALGNLLDNAIQHLPPACRITVFTSRRDGTAVLGVSDDGPGFPEEVRDHAFERFVKGRSSKGYGLGLSLVHAAARAHGGEASISDRAGGGAEITITFP